MNEELELKRAVHSTILDVMDTGGGTVHDVIAAIHEIYPNMCDVYGSGYVNRVVLTAGKRFDQVARAQRRALEDQCEDQQEVVRASSHAGNL